MLGVGQGMWGLVARLTRECRSIPYAASVCTVSPDPEPYASYALVLTPSSLDGVGRHAVSVSQYSRHILTLVLAAQ
jgi:hypothetical protein